MQLTSSHIILNAPSVADAKQWINQNDPDYFDGYSGDCFLICNNPHRWQQTVANPRKVISTLLKPDVLGFHLLAEIKNNEVYNAETLDTWFSKTLAHIQSDIDDELLPTVFSQLTKWGMLYIEGDNYKITRLGRISAMLYYFPSDIFHWAKKFSTVDLEDLWDNDLALSYVLGTTPSLDLPYVPKAEEEAVTDYTNAVAEVWPEDNYSLKKSVLAAKLYDLLSQGETSPSTRNLQYDIDRVTTALAWIDGIKDWHQAAFWKALPIRIKYGVGQELVELCSLPGIGVVRARKLYAGGIVSASDILEKREFVRTLLGPKTANKLFAGVRDTV